MNKFFFFLTLAVCGVSLALKAAPVLSETSARDYLKNGALVIDVRTAAEFKTKHLTNVVNIPLAELKAKLPAQIADKRTVVLLHCQSGQRSGQAQAQLQAMGYTNAFNLGSYDRAAKIVGGKD